MFPPWADEAAPGGRPGGSGMEEIAIQVGRYGLPLVFLSVFVEQAGLPIPATPVLVLCGALAARGEMSLALALVTAVSASYLADALWYYLARRYGVRVLRSLCRISLNPESCVRQTEVLFERYGLLSIVFAKFVPGLATVAPPLAGAMGVGSVRFALATSLGALLWAAASMSVGWIFHGTIETLAEILEALGFWGLVILALLLAAVVGYKAWKRRRFYRQLRMSRISPQQLQTLREESPDTMIFDVRTDLARKTD